MKHALREHERRQPLRWRAAGSLAPLLVCLLAAACPSRDRVPRAPAIEPATIAVTPGVPIELVILHTNDIHGKFRDTPATWLDDNPPIGGFANLSALIERQREAHPNTLLLDAGDLMTGNPICDYDYEGVRGGAMMELMNRVGYDAMCLGNHEFDHGLENLRGLMALARFPMLGANVFEPSGPRTAPHAYAILQRGGLRVGIIGLVIEDLYAVAAPSRLAGTKVTSPAAEARKIVNDIDDETDLIVLLTHMGVDDDRKLARELDGVDVIVGGHSHTRVREPIVENGIVIVQAGAHGRNLGRLRLTVVDDAVQSFDGELLEAWPADGGRDGVVEMVAAYAERIEQDFGSTIGRLSRPWKRSYSGESNIGNWIADRLREQGEGDFAVINSGGIRKDVAAGPITKLDVMEILPFENTVTTFTCSGRELERLVEHNAHASVNARGILQVSGLRYAYAVVDGDVEVLDVTCNGEPLDPGRTYRGVTVDYVSHQNAERYFGFVPRELGMIGDVVSQSIIRAIERSREIDARVDGRMRRAEAGERRAAG